MAENEDKKELWDSLVEKAKEDLPDPDLAPPDAIVSVTVPVFDTEAVLKQRVDEPGRGLGDRLKNPVQAVLKKMVIRGPQRALALVPDDACRQLRRLRRTFPNFGDFLEMIERQLRLVIRCEPAVISVPPICLLGPPGVGKTAVVRRVFKILGLPFEFVSCPDLTASFVLSGTSPMWANSHYGKVARTLVDGDFANAGFILDEIDKLPLRGNYPPDGALYRLLERTTAATFRDEYLDVELDASHLLWLTTANEMDAIPPALRSRLMFVHVRAPTTSEMDAVIDSVNAELRQEFRPIRESFAERVPDSVKSLVINLPPRDLKRALMGAYACAAARGTSKRKGKLLPSDIRVPRGPRKVPFGFAPEVV